MSPRSASLVALLALGPGAAPASAALRLDVPRARAEGTRLPVVVRGGPADARVTLARRAPHGWRVVARGRADGRGRAAFRLAAPLHRVRWRLRGRVAGLGTTPGRTVAIRPVVLDAVGDINLGDGAGAVMAARGPRFPWRHVAPTLRRADIAFGNLECAVSRRGAPVPGKTFHFRGPPGWLSTVHGFAGMDALNLANNHSGDYGKAAAADTVRAVRAHGMLAVGGGLSLGDAARPKVIERLGLRVAFVGFLDIEPASFAAGPHTPGARWATLAAVRHDVRAARRRADVVVASFHWGVEYTTRPTARQRALARAALAAGATAVIAAHPHVLQPIERPARHRVVAYSLGDFVWSPRNAAAGRTGILSVALSRRGVEHVGFRRATILGTAPTFR